MTTIFYFHANWIFISNLLDTVVTFINAPPEAMFGDVFTSLLWNYFVYLVMGVISAFWLSYTFRRVECFVIKHKVNRKRLKHNWNSFLEDHPTWTTTDLDNLARWLKDADLEGSFEMIVFNKYPIFPLAMERFYLKFSESNDLAYAKLVWAGMND